MATVAPVLYTNINFPNLKEEFPDWTTRVKQIAKLWSKKKETYMQKARDNRAALRINKVQMSNDSMKRQQQQDSIDPSSRVDSELLNPLKAKESEHDRNGNLDRTTIPMDSICKNEKLRQRQKLREIILQQQQQQKIAALPDPHHSYPGTLGLLLPSLGPRYAVSQKISVDPILLIFGFPGGSHGTMPSQERFLVPPQQIQGSGVSPQLRRSISVDMPRPLNNSQMNNPVGLPQHFSPQSLPVQQHNILGQAYIELRHRASDGRQ
ncbi:KMT2C isoform 9 [Pongo abelii]|uniref:KMT2C isoform 9 n=1 Tax=Pongo abelii TaxID=9601 RepID=A0A2J8XQY8_PONAB|nr:KMT2C isoform 9 [Pongo abelii]